MSRLKMKFLIPSVLLILFVKQSTQESNIAVNEFSQKFIELDLTIWKDQTLDENVELWTNNAIDHYRKFTKVLHQYLPEQTYNVRAIQKNGRWSSYTREINQINSVYENFRGLIQADNALMHPEKQWLEFAKSITKDPIKFNYLKNTVPNLMKNMQAMISDQNLFKNILNHLIFEKCDNGQSNNQILFNVYKTVALVQLKGYIMNQFAYIILLFNNEEPNARTISERNRKEFKTNSLRTIEKIKEAMRIGNRDIWKCDPKQYVKDETYTELTELLQGYIENEVDMNPRSNCLQNCAYYDYTQNMGCFQGLCKRQRVCHGKILKCQYIDSDMSVCEAPKNSGRRYDYIEYENDRVFGRNTGCKKATTKVDSWWRWLFWHCSYCLCLCDDAGPQSDRYFSLKEVVSAMNDNMIVTGLRLKKVHQVIHLQIQEGKLLPYGNVNESSTRWKPIDSFRIGKNVRDTVDYHTMAYEKRDLDLDNIMVPNKYIVTGVKFHVIGTHLKLEVRATPFNFTTGLLLQPNIKSHWISEDETLGRKLLSLRNPDVPTRTQSPSMPDSESNMYLEFSNSDLERDVGQATIPFIDIQDVTSEVPVPLSGVGIYHKGQPNFGGFVAPKIFTYDYSKHIFIN